MLSDILKGICSKSYTDGVSMYSFISDSMAVGEYIPNKNRTLSDNLELFFCCEGLVVLHCGKNTDLEIKGGDVVLFEGSFKPDSVFVKESVVGCCLDIDIKNCKVLDEMCRALNHADLNYKHIEKILKESRGYLKIKASSWNQSTLNIFACLSEKNQMSYGILKAVELLYLLNIQYPASKNILENPPIPGYLAECLECIKNYIEKHLDEKLTIPLLCHKFNISPTTLKNKFRELYGYPVHNWILFCRVQKASELLRCTNMTVLQIAQSVGYESTSQFNVVFRRAYGVAPSLYRKNVQYNK